MRRIKVSEGGVADLVSGKIVFPEPPAAATLEPSLLNSWQEELSTAIELSGHTLNENKRDQLWESIRRPGRISAPLTLTVASNAIPSSTSFTTLQAALDSLVGRYIDPGVEVTIQNNIALLTLTTPLVISLTQGDQVTVRSTSVGAQSTLNNKISFSAHLASGGSYIRLKKGCSIKFENINFSALGSGTALAHSMFQVGQGSFVSIKNARLENIVGNMVIAEDGGIVELTDSFISGCNLPTGTDSFKEQGHGVVARRAGIVKATATTVDVSTHSAFIADKVGYMTAANCTARSHGFEARQGSSLLCSSCVAEGNNAAKVGFHATGNSSMRLLGCLAGISNSFKTETGVLAQQNSHIFAQGCTAYSNDYGFLASHNSQIDCLNTLSYAGDVGYCAFVGSIITHNNSSGAGTADVVFFPAFGTNGDQLNRIGPPLALDY